MSSKLVVRQQHFPCQRQDVADTQAKKAATYQQGHVVVLVSVELSDEAWHCVPLHVVGCLVSVSCLFHSINILCGLTCS